jgi:hypothetical protein
MRHMRGRLVGLLCVGTLLLAAGEARAAPVALLDAPDASGLALAGSEALVAREGARGGVRIDALPVAGGAVRPVATMRPPRRGVPGFAALSASPQRVAALVTYNDEGGYPTESQLWTGPPAGPLRRELRASWGALRGWIPFAIDVDGDRLLVVEGRLGDLRFRARVLASGAAPVLVPWRGDMRPPAALAGDRVAFVGEGPGGREQVVVMDWRTGTVTARTADADVVELDLAPDGRVATESEDSGLEGPRFAGDRIVALAPGRFGTLRPVLLDPSGGPPAPLGVPTSELDALAADPSGAAWIANGCVLYAPLSGAVPVEPPDGPCPRAEVVVEEGDQILRGRRVRFTAACVAAPATGCRGTVLVRGDGGPILGRGRFQVAAGRRRRVDVVLTRRGLRYVHAGLRREGAAFFGVRVRTPGGRHADDGVSGAVVDRRAGDPRGHP